MPDVPHPDAPDRESHERPVPPPPEPPAKPASGPPTDSGDADASRTRAVWALALAIVPLCVTWVAAVVLAVMVLAGPRDGRRRGRPMAWSALTVVALWGVASVVATVVIVVSSGGDGDGRDDRDDRDRVGASASEWDDPWAPSDDDQLDEETFDDEVAAEDLEVGDCLAEDLASGDEEVFSVSGRPCEEPHNAEVFHEFDLDDGDYPDESDIWDIADEGCYAAFEPWVGLAYEDSELEFSYYYPTRQSWKYGDRAVSCLVLAPADVTGTLQGSGR